MAVVSHTSNMINDEIGNYFGLFRIGFADVSFWLQELATPESHVVYEPQAAGSKTHPW